VRPLGRARLGSGALALLFGLITALSVAPPVAASPADISVTLAQSGQIPVAAGDTITYQLTVSNAGTTDSGQVTVTDALSYPSYYIDNSATCGSVPNCTVTLIPLSCPVSVTPCVGTTVVWTISAVAAGATGLVLSAEVGIGGAGSSSTPSITDQASWTGDGCTTSPGCSTNQVSDPLFAPQIGISSDPPDGSSVQVGQTISFTINIANPGDAAAPVPLVVTSGLVNGNGVTGSASCSTVPSCTVTSSTSSGVCTYPSGATYACTPTTSFTWTIATVAPGASGLELHFSAVATQEAISGPTRGPVAVSALWQGNISPPVAAFSPGTSYPYTSGPTLYVTSGDGCVSSGLPTAGGSSGPSASDSSSDSDVPDYPCDSNIEHFTATGTPIKGATTISTGEPWSGSWPWEVLLFALGSALIGLGVFRKRRMA